MERVTPPAMLAGDVVYEPDDETRRMYRVLEVRAVRTNRTLVHVMDLHGSMLRELPNTVEYPIERATS